MNALPLIDIHAHIHQHDGRAHADIVARAKSAGVREIVVAGTTVADSHAAVDMARRFDIVSAGVGIHPDQISSAVGQDEIDALDAMAQLPEVVAMSEFGIDFIGGKPTHQHQQDAFLAQLDIAKRRRLPIIIHLREHSDNLTSFEARGVALSILASEGLADAGGAMHYFQGDYDYAKRVLDLGMHISLAKPLLRLPELQDVARRLPIDRIVLETDSYPQPFKRNRNKWTEPRDLPMIAEYLADLRGETVREVARQTTRNALRLLRHPPA